MKRIDVFSAEHVPSGPNAALHSEAVLHRGLGDGLIAAMFSGPWCRLAAAAFASEFGSGSAARAFAGAIRAVDDRWRSLSEEERWDQGWSGTACGVALDVTPDRCQCTWLGDNQAYHLRDRGIIDAIAPHTVFQAMKQAGHENVDPKWTHYLMRWLSSKHAADSVTWPLQTGDMVLVCSPHVAGCSIPDLIERCTPSMLVDELANAPGAKETRVSHTVFAIKAGET